MFGNDQITPNVFAAMTADEYARCGYKLGDEVKIRNHGDFVLSEAQEDLVVGALVAPVLATGSIRYYHANAPVTVEANGHELDTEDPYILITNAGATVEAGALAGLRIIIQLDTNGGTLIGRIKTNTAGASSATNLFKIYLMEPLQAALTALPTVEVYDPNYVCLADKDETRLANGVSQLIVDQSEAPYFWRQISGDAIIKDEAGDVATGLGVQVASTTPGEFIVLATTNGEYDAHWIGNVIHAANVAHSLALVKLNRLS